MNELQWVNEAVAGFGRSIGLPSWALDAQRRAALRLQSGRALAVELLDDGEVLLLLECPLAFEGPDLLQRALEAAHLRQGRLLQLGLRGSGADQTLIVATRLAWRDVSPPLLARRFEQLLDWLSQVADPTVPRFAEVPG